jgi:hypothetical protein
MASPCASIQEAITGLQTKIATLKAEKTAQEAQGLKTAPIDAQINMLQSELHQETILLQKCQQNSFTTPGPSNLVLVATEQTQCIQIFDIPFYNYPEVGEMTGNNLVPMVAQKETMLRLYIDASLYHPGQPVPAFVNGSITLQIPGSPVTIPSLNGPIEARKLDQIDPTQLSQTLNFLIPKDLCIGQVNYSVSISDPTDATQHFSAQQTITFITVPTLKLHPVMIHYTAPDSAGNPQDLTVDFADFVTVINEIQTVYPIGNIVIDGIETLEFSKSLTVDANWSVLLDQVSGLREASGSNAVYLGFVPEDAFCGGVCGKGAIGGGACVFRAGPGMDPEQNVCHEMGHAVGRIHAPECLSPGDPGDPNYPQYPGLPRASIGYVGVDPRSLVTKDPRTFRDYMSYCLSCWTSPYGYLLEMATFRSGAFSDPVSALIGKVPVKKPTDYYLIGFSRTLLNSAVQIKFGYHVKRTAPINQYRKRSSVMAYVFNAQDELVSNAYGISQDASGGPGFSENGLFIFPRTEQMTRMIVMDGDKTLAEWKIAGEPPTVSITKMEVDTREASRQLHLSWKGSAPKGAIPALSYTLRFSADGANWQAFLFDTQLTHHIIDLDALPGGEACRVQVLASAGLRTTIAETAPFSSVVKPRTTKALKPASGSAFPQNTPIALSIMSWSPDFGNPPQEEIIWNSLKQGYLGSGSQLSLTNLPVGSHWLQVHFPTGQGELASEQINIKVTA